MTATAAPPLLGTQTATVELIQPGDPGMQAERLAHAIGVNLMEWQRRVLRAFTARRDDHWAAREGLLLVPRQQGKTLLLMMRILAGALLFGEKEILYTAHEYTTSKAFFRELTELIKTTPLLERELLRSWTSNGDFRLQFKNGAQLRLLARTAHAGRGLHPDLIIFDESFTVSDDILLALIPGQAARPDPQVIWASSAGDDTSVELIKMRRRLHSGADPYLTGFDWFAPKELAAEEPATWARALPSYGVLTSEVTVRQALMTLSRTGFERELLGRWEEVVETKIFSTEQIDAVATDPLPAPDDPAAAQLAFGVEIVQTGTMRISASVVGCWYDADLRPTLSVIRSEPGVEWLISFVRYLASAYPGSPIAYDAKSPGLDLFERITRDGEVEMTRVDWPDYSRSCSAFLQGVAEERIRVCRQPTSLIMDMAAVKQKTVGATWCWERVSVAPPASLIAGTCALFATELADHGTPEIK